MTTPYTSVAPTPPSGSSNPISLRGWLAAICSWLAGLSPVGATKHSTGLVTLSAPGAPVTVKAVRSGKGVTLWVGGGQGVASMGNIIVGPANIVPTEIRPPEDAYGPAEIRWTLGGLARLKVDAFGSIWLWNPSPVDSDDWGGSVSWTLP